MNTSLTRNEKILAYMIVTTIGGFAALFLQINFRSNSSMSHIENPLQVNYKMARPEEGYSEYSLNGREIDHDYQGLPHARQPLAKTTGVANPKSFTPKTEPQKKTEAAKKKLEESQRAAALARAQQMQARQNQALQNSARTQAKSEPQNRAGSQSQSETETYEQRVANSEKSPQPNRPTEDPKAKNKKTFAQWRTQIFTQPTRENVAAFLEAYRKGEVTATEVQAMAQDMMDQNDETLKGLGIYTLRSTPSLASLSQLVHIEAQMSATYRAYIEQAYLSYLQPQNVTYLNQALQTKDKTLIAKTLSLLNTNLPNVAKGNNAAFVDPRSGREAGAGSNISISSFTSLLPALSALANSQDQDYTGLAQQAISYIQSSNVAQY